jgi:endonuclease G, mitochondrial
MKRRFSDFTRHVVAMAALWTAAIAAACTPKPAPTAASSPVPMAPPVAAPAPPGPRGMGRPVAGGNTAKPLTPALAQMVLGNPDNATPNPANREHYLIQRSQYALSYNDRLRFPNWVAWRLQARDIGDVDRGNFQPDPQLPSGFTRVTPTDYTRSGYDRGHNCPSKDRSATRQDNDVAFYMTNITPQQHGMNGGPWNLLEEYCRNLAEQGNELYIYCGHGFEGKEIKTIGKNGVAVPDFGWKVVVVVPNGAGNPLSRITSQTRVIAVRMPNISTIARQDWRDFRVSVADIEQATGLTFFSALPAATAAALKNRTDFDMSSPTKRQGRRSEPSGGSTEPESSSGSPAASGETRGQVWVNTRSGVYWRPGTEFYGKTKQGKYMSEGEAKAEGFRAAQGQ